MKCSRYKELLDGWAERDLALKEINELNIHCEKCDECKHEYLAMLKYKNISSKLKHLEPVLSGKEAFINEILDALPDEPLIAEAETAVLPPLFSYKLRIMLASIAATLVLLFAIQQTMDAFKIKQMEVRMSQTNNVIDYGLIRTNLALGFFRNGIGNSLIFNIYLANKAQINNIEISKFLNKNSFGILKFSRLNSSDLSALIDSNYQLLKLKSHEKK
ncbi:MAG: hypothetical protein P1P88_22740 [Bacteroidales bacterium]|nr:hypothetical protein [Bacteroidales bacterium]